MHCPRLFSLPLCRAEGFCGAFLRGWSSDFGWVSPAGTLIPAPSSFLGRIPSKVLPVGRPCCIAVRKPTEYRSVADLEDYWSDVGRPIRTESLRLQPSETEGTALLQFSGARACYSTDRNGLVLSEERFLDVSYSVCPYARNGKVLYRSRATHALRSGTNGVLDISSRHRPHFSTYHWNFSLHSFLRFGGFSWTFCI